MWCSCPCWRRTIASPFPKVKMGTDGGILGNSLDSESTTNLQKVLEMSTRIFMCLPTKLAGLHHADQSWLELKSVVSYINCWSSSNVGSGWSGELTESFVSHVFKHLC
jgi:hypothetical protein